MLSALKDGKMEKIYDAIENIDIEKTEASEEKDKWNIMEIVKKEDGGVEKLNNEIRVVFRDWLESVIMKLVETETKLSDDATADLNLAGLLNSLGGMYNKQGKYESALQYYDRCRTIKENVHGTNHPKLANTYNSIGGVYCQQGKFVEALKYYNKCRVVKEKALGSYHPHMAVTHGNIGFVYMKQDKYEEALKSYEKCKIMQESSLGPQHPNLASTYYNIALLHKHQNRKKGDTLKYLRKALAIYDVSLGQDHSKTKNVQNKITEVERDRERE